MQSGSSVAARLVLLLGLIVSTAAPARAVDFSLEVLINGSSAGTLDAAALGCSDTGPVTATCSNTNVNVGGASGLLIENLNLSLDTDPFVNGLVAVQNLNPGTQQFTMIFSLITVPFGPPTSMNGAVNGGVTDNTGDGALLSTTGPGSALYTGLINNSPAATLYTDAFGLSVVNSFESANLPIASFGPSPTGVGVAVTKIGLQYDFNLTGGDSASFTGRFEVVPEPATALLVGVGLAALAFALRRR